jgi:hypothetical protein
VEYAPASFSAVASAPPAHQALEQILSGVDPDTFVSAGIGSAPSPDDWQGNWFYATVKADAIKDAADLPALWEADLVQGALAEDLDEDQPNLANVIVGSSFSVQLPDGSIKPADGGAGDVAAGQSFSNAPDDQIIAAAKSTLASYGLQPHEVRVLHPLGPALYVVATVADLKKIQGQLELLRHDLIGKPALYEGLYLELRDSAGESLARYAIALRSGTGRLWIRPGLDVDLGTAHG